jgi:RHS repeat-associated protein
MCAPNNMRSGNESALRIDEKCCSMEDRSTVRSIANDRNDTFPQHQICRGLLHGRCHLADRLSCLVYSGYKTVAREQRRTAGHEYDAGSGLNYMDARYYDPSTSRFLSEDPMFLQVGPADWENGMASDPLGDNGAHTYAGNTITGSYANPDAFTVIEEEIATSCRSRRPSRGLPSRLRNIAGRPRR